MKMEQIVCSETSAYKIQTPGNYPEENIQQLNMFRVSSCPSPGATTTAVAASGLPSEFGGGSAVGRGRGRSARPRPIALLPPNAEVNQRLLLQM
jgi:hypothetical protein